MSTDLNQLTDAELSAVFAVEVAGWTKTNDGWLTEAGHHAFSVFCVDIYGNPNFATSMDAVLPYLAGKQFCLIKYDDRPYELDLAGDVIIEALDTTPARAACIALILAARAEKEAAK